MAYGLAGLAVICGAVFLVWFGVTTTADEYDFALWIPFLVAAAVLWVPWRRQPIPLLLAIATAFTPGAAQPRQPRG